MSHIPEAIDINIHKYNQCSNVPEHLVQSTAGLPAARCHTNCLLCAIFSTTWRPRHAPLPRVAGLPADCWWPDADTAPWPNPKTHWAPLLRVQMCRGQNTYTVVGVILYWSYKKPWKTKTKINITVRLQTKTILQLQYHLQYNLHSRYKISIIHPSRIHP